MKNVTYEELLERKKHHFKSHGFSVDDSDLNKNLFDFQKSVVKWALRKGKAALFEGTGLGKTIQELSWAEQVHRITNKPVLIIAPLAVVPQTVSEANKFGISAKQVFGNDQVFNGKPAYVLPHPSPLNRRWFKTYPEFEAKRVKEIRAVIKSLV